MKAVIKCFDETYSNEEVTSEKLNKRISTNLARFSKYDSSLRNSLSMKTHRVTVYDLSSKKD